MSDDDVRDLAQKALLRAARNAAEKKTRPKTPAPQPTFFVEEAPAKSEDALDRQAFRKGGFGKAEKRAYAQQKFAEELVQPPKNPPPAWLNDPSLLPKKPPNRSE